MRSCAVIPPEWTLPRHAGVVLVAAGEFPKGSVSMRTQERRGREGGRVTRPALGSQFGSIRGSVRERERQQSNVRPVETFHHMRV